MIIAVVGPTGVGKTKLSVELAKEYNAIVINFDAVQVYKKLNIGSAKVTEEEKEGIKHLLFDIKNPDEEYSVKEYQEDLRKILAKYQNQNVVLVGGTGLYLCAGLMDYRFEDETKNNTYDNLTNEKLYNLVLQKDPNSKIHPNNRVRLIRFLNRQNTEIVPPKLLYSNVYFIGLTTSRETLYTKINKRVDIMLENGLLNEVQNLYNQYPNSKVLHSAIGYKEIIAYLDGNITLDDAINKIKQNSRHYAKRQYTWFNNKMDVKWFNVNYDNFNETINDVKNYINNAK